MSKRNWFGSMFQWDSTVEHGLRIERAPEERILTDRDWRQDVDIGFVFHDPHNILKKVFVDPKRLALIDEKTAIQFHGSRQPGVLYRHYIGVHDSSSVVVLKNGHLEMAVTEPEIQGRNFQRFMQAVLENH